MENDGFGEGLYNQRATVRFFGHYMIQINKHTQQIHTRARYMEISSITLIKGLQITGLRETAIHHGVPIMSGGQIGLIKVPYIMTRGDTGPIDALNDEY